MRENGKNEGSFMEPEQFRKLFIGGLNYRTSDEGLRDFYTQWGNLTDSVVMKDGQTGKSRGFGFVTFGTTAMVDSAMRDRPHEIDGRQVQPKRAVPREDTNSPGSNLSVKKIFIAGLRDQEIEKEDLEDYFSAFGNVTDCGMMLDKETKKCKGFAYVVFDDYDSVDKVILQKYHTIFDVPLEVKKAAPKEVAGSNRRESKGGGRGSHNGGRNQGGRGGRGGGGGGGYFGGNRSAKMDNEEDRGFPGNMGPDNMGPRNMGPGNMGSDNMNSRNMGPGGMGGRNMGPGGMGPGMGQGSMGSGNMGQGSMGNMGRNMDQGNMGPNMGPNNMSNNMGPNNMSNNMGPNNMGQNNMCPNNMGPNNMGPNNMGPNNIDGNFREFNNFGGRFGGGNDGRNFGDNFGQNFGGGPMRGGRGDRPGPYGGGFRGGN